MATDFVKIPAQGTGDTTPQVATEAGTASDASATAIQQISLVNMTAYLHSINSLLAQALSLAADPGSGRLRVLLEQINFPAAQTSNVNIASTAANATVTIGSLSAVAGGGNKPDTMIFDAMQNAWANSVNPVVSRY